IRNCQSPVEKSIAKGFILSDLDGDMALNDHELNELQVKCLNAPLPPSEIERVKGIIKESVPEGLNEHGFTMEGFLAIHGPSIEKRAILFLEAQDRVKKGPLFKSFVDTSVQVPKSGYPIPAVEVASVELTSDAVDFLKGIFSMYDNGDSQNTQLEVFFPTAPESPWDEAPYQNSVERNKSGDMTLSGFLSGLFHRLSSSPCFIRLYSTVLFSLYSWALMTLLDPAKSLAYLIYMLYVGDPATALRVTRKRTLDVKKQQSDRQVFQCFVFGPKNAGKSALLSSFVGRPFQDSYVTSNQSYTVNFVDHLRGTKTLVLHEIQEDDVKQVLSSKESLAACDVAIFMYDSSDKYSLKRASELLMDVARRGEDTGYGVPCLFIAAKDDLDSYPEAIGDSKAICQEIKIEEPIRISVKGSDMNRIFWRIVNAAERCSSIPETQYGRNKKQYRRLVNQSLMFASGLGLLG
ncbi:mitochondrial Rho GTPase 2-like protein, partial [Tanacetum coccineum]